MLDIQIYDNIFSYVHKHLNNITPLREVLVKTNDNSDNKHGGVSLTVAICFSAVTGQVMWYTVEIISITKCLAFLEPLTFLG
jgi:hypothetical protein